MEVEALCGPLDTGDVTTVRHRGMLIDGRGSRRIENVPYRFRTSAFGQRSSAIHAA